MDAIDNLLTEPALHIGGTPATFGTLLAAVFVLIATYIIASLTKRAIKRHVKRVSQNDSGTAGSYSTLAQIIIWFVGLELALHLLNIHLSSLFAAIGVFTLGAGFAVKNIIENFSLAGFYASKKPYGLKI